MMRILDLLSLGHRSLVTTSYPGSYCEYMSISGSHVLIASALKRGVNPPGTSNFNMFSGGDDLSFRAVAKNMTD